MHPASNAHNFSVEDPIWIWSAQRTATEDSFHQKTSLPPQISLKIGTHVGSIEKPYQTKTLDYFDYSPLAIRHVLD